MALLLVSEEEGLERTVDLASIFNVRHPCLSSRKSVSPKRSVSAPAVHGMKFTAHTESGVA
jgi:hypothetical protein